ncbi:hypothetical protein PIB30_064080 [Stylosanthes scabra]|uniref:Uncharacterized protein n=1 Tax=Stylosanthes scabra TaxID=79078 RepID=A0ABU6VL63_9FABA|nr:hypothetical protein [Stylosanthes scabra]
MHAKWLGKVFKKKFELNLKVKIKELVAKADRKWNLTVTASMAARTRRNALDGIQGSFRDQYKRLGDYAAELLRANPGFKVSGVCARGTEFKFEYAQLVHIPKVLCVPGCMQKELAVLQAVHTPRWMLPQDTRRWTSAHSH